MQRKRSMRRLLERLRFSDFQRPEPNPFVSLDRLRQEYGDERARKEQESGADSAADEEDEEIDARCTQAANA